MQLNGVYPCGTFDQMAYKLLDETKPDTLSKEYFTYKVFDIYNGEIPKK